MIKYIYKEGQTPIDQDEAEALIPDLSTQDDLNEWEQANIIDAQNWLASINIEKVDILNEEFIKKLHYRMFDKTWGWAGEFRKNNKNIGVESYQISTELRKLIDDVMFWLKNKSESIRRIALMFHHRLVKIHLFSNGNGRHARIMGDLLVKKYCGDKIKWDNANYKRLNEFRKQYIISLKRADGGNYSMLFELLD